MGVADILLAAIVRLTSIVEEQYRVEFVSETGIRFSYFGAIRSCAT